MEYEESLFMECHIGEKGSNMRYAIGNGIIIGLSIALLWHLSNIWRYGSHLINEPSVLVLILETVGMFLILVFGISKYISDIKREIRKEDAKRDWKR